MIQNVKTVNIFGGNFLADHTTPPVAGRSRRDVDVDPGTAGVRPDHDIYYDQLLLKQKGYPMWLPGPDLNLSPEYRRRGIAIGDIGILYCAEGFTFLFNIFFPAGHPINKGRVPKGFEHLDFAKVQQGKRLQSLGQKEYTSSSVRKLSTPDPSNFTFETSTEGAVLVMPDGGISEDLFSLKSVKNYLAKHAEGWYEFVSDQPFELDVDNGDIRLVIGTDKVSSWGIATVACSVRESVRLSFSRQDNGPAASTIYAWNCHGSAQGRVGPDEETMVGIRRDSDTSPLRNQCVFVRTLNFELSGKVWAALDVHRIRPRGRLTDSPQPEPPVWNRHSATPVPSDDGRLQVSREHSTSSRWSVIDNPSDTINSWLLKQNPTARIAITGDADWISVIGTDVEIPARNEICARVINTHDICEEDGIVTVAPLQPVLRRRPSVSKKVVGFMLTVWQSVTHNKAKNSPQVVICIGPYGSGKSQFIDTLTTRTSWANHGIRPAQQAHVRSIDMKFPVCDRTFTLIDTPGFDDFVTTVDEVLEKAADFIKKRSRKNDITVFILYFHNITTNRLTLPPPTSLLEKLCGNDAARQFVFVTTHWDKVGQGTGAAREAELKGHFKTLLTMGATTARFDKTAESAWKIIEPFFRNDALSLQRGRPLAGEEMESEGHVGAKVLLQP